MSKGHKGASNFRPGRGSINDRLEQAKIAKQALLTRLSEQQDAPKPIVMAAVNSQDEIPPARNQANYIAALEAIPFWQTGRLDKVSVSKSYKALVDTSLRCLNNKAHEAVLCWPNCLASPSAIANLIAMSDVASAQPTRVGEFQAFEAPTGLRALIFPYASTAHRSLRQIFIDKDYLGQTHIRHQLRANKGGEDEGLADFHKALARSRTLTGRALDGNAYDEFRHPCLDELIPSGPCSGNEGRQELLWRVYTKTDLKKISRTGAANDVSKAPYYLFGLRSKDPLVPSLRALGKKIDIIFLDLCSTGRARLGRNWLQRVKTFLNEIEIRLGPVAIVALTDDPWSFDTLRFNAMGRVLNKKRTIPAASSVLFAQSSDIVGTPDAPDAEYSKLEKQDVLGFSGEIEDILIRLRTCAAEAETLADNEAADLLRQLIGVMRRCASLPGARDDFSMFLEQEIGGLGAADRLASYRVASPLKELRNSIGPWAQLQTFERKAVLAKVEAIWNNTAELTPMAPLLRDVVKKFLRVSSRAVFLFRNDMIADFASFALSKDDEIGEIVKSRFDKEMISFLDKSDLDDLTQLPTARRNSIKTLVVVAPTRAQILSLFAVPWLPENLIVLGDSDTLRMCASDARRLAQYNELSVISGRLNAFAEKAELVIHKSSGVGLDEGAMDDVEFPTSSVLNLAGKVRPDQQIIRLQFSGNQTIIARPGTKLILQDTGRAVPVFNECEAKEVDIGDKVCVIGDAFLEMARPLLNITVRAAEEIRDYHQLVLDRFQNIPGTTQNDKLTQIVRTMALEGVTTQRASYWVNLEEQKNLPLHEVVPHAPRERATFLSFMAALGVGNTVALRYWTWAVIAQRSTRHRAAINFHDAYRSILIDNYAAQSADPKRSREIKQLKAFAEDFVATVTHKTLERGDHAPV